MRSLRKISVAAGLTIGVSALTAGTPTAQAATSWTSSTSGVLYGTCLNHAYRYSLSLPAGAIDWSLSVDLIAPDGTTEDSDFLWYEDGDPATGTSSFLFCGAEMPGRYVIAATGEWDDSDYNSHPFTLPYSTFSMRQPYSRTRLRVSDRTPSPGQVVRFRIGTTDERPRGYFRTAYASVVLQHRVGRRWKAYRWGHAITNARGVVTLKARFRGRPVRVRARTLPEGYTTSYSRVVRLHR